MNVKVIMYVGRRAGKVYCDFRINFKKERECLIIVVMATVIKITFCPLCNLVLEMYSENPYNFPL